MRYVEMTGTDLHVSAICLGTGALGSTVPQQEAFELLDLFLELGGNFLDSAKVYADWLPGERSVSEKTIGRWLRSRAVRDRVLVATKGAHPELATMDVPRLSPEEIVGDLDASLSSLQVDTIDLYWLHRDDPARPVGEIIETLHDQVVAGKIRYYGCSNWRAPRIAAAQAYATAHGFTGFVADQMQWSLAQPAPRASGDPTMVAMHEELYAYHRDTGMPAVPYSSQAGGYFQKIGAREEERLGPGARRRYDHAVNRQRLARIKELGAETGLSVTQLALGYLLSQPFPTIPIVGCKTKAHLRDSLSAADVSLTPGQVTYLESGKRA
jgi:aryl-alcohol dehydrogenase-like predicted oxidoreductase